MGVEKGYQVVACDWAFALHRQRPDSTAATRLIGELRAVPVQQSRATMDRRRERCCFTPTYKVTINALCRSRLLFDGYLLQCTAWMKEKGGQKIDTELQTKKRILLTTTGPDLLKNIFAANQALADQPIDIGPSGGPGKTCQH